MSDVDTGAAVAAADTTAIASQTVEAPVNTMDAIAKTMSETYDKINPPRSDDGKWVARSGHKVITDPAEKAAAQELIDKAGQTEITDQTQTPPVEPAKPAIDAPVSWSAEMKAKFATLPPDVQAYAVQRDGEAHKRISELGQQVKAYEPIRTVIEQYGETFRRNGLQPHDGIARMMAVHDMLEQDAPTAIREIAKAYGVDLSNGSQDTGNESAEVRSLKSEIQALKRQVGETVSKVTARERSEAEREQANLASTIEKFSKDKPHFEAVRSVMAGLMQSGAAETLDDAYDMAIHANKSIRETIDADKRKAEQDKTAEEAKKKADQAKKAASLNVKGTSGSPAKKGSWEETLRAVGERIAS
jgi:hypothetical protein